MLTAQSSAKLLTGNTVHCRLQNGFMMTNAPVASATQVRHLAVNLSSGSG